MDAYTDGDTNLYAGTDLYGNADSDRYGNAGRHGHSYGDANLYTGTDLYGDADRIGYSYGDTDPYTDYNAYSGIACEWQLCFRKNGMDVFGQCEGGKRCSCLQFW